MSDQESQLTQTAGQDPAVMLARMVALRALQHLVGHVHGRTVLDLSCGDGKLSRWLAVHGAHVTSVDDSMKSIESAKRVESADPHGITYVVGDADDLNMINDSTFDVVICHLALDRFESISLVVAEVSRIIKLGGRFIFSVGHPYFQQRLFTNEDCIQKYTLEGASEGLSGSIRHRMLSAYINAVAARGFTVRRVLEPAADEHDISKYPGLENWQHIPAALVVEAVFPYI